MRRSTVGGVLAWIVTILILIFIGIVVFAAIWFVGPRVVAFFEGLDQNAAQRQAAAGQTPVPTAVVYPQGQGTPVPQETPGLQATSAPGLQTGGGPTGLTINRLAQNDIEILRGTELIARLQAEEAVELPTEYLLNRPCAYLEQSGMGVRLNITLTLGDNAAFAADGDYFTVNGTSYGSPGPGDALIFADSAGTYRFMGESFGLCLAPVIDPQDRAGALIKDRQYGRSLPQYFFSPNGTLQLQ